MYRNVQSLEEVVHVEIYEVIDKEAYDTLMVKLCAYVNNHSLDVSDMKVHFAYHKLMSELVLNGGAKNTLAELSDLVIIGKQ